FWIQRNRHDQRSMPLLHTHEFVELIYVDGGQATHLFQDTSYEINKGDIFMINPGEKHGYTVTEGQTIEVINCLFHPDFIASYVLRELRLGDSLDFFYVQPFLNREIRFNHKLNLGAADADKTRGILEELHREMTQQDSGYQALVQLRMTELFILLSRYYNKRKHNLQSPSPNELLVSRVCGYVACKSGLWVCRKALQPENHAADAVETVLRRGAPVKSAFQSVPGHQCIRICAVHPDRKGQAIADRNRRHCVVCRTSGRLRGCRFLREIVCSPMRLFAGQI
ncbi:MAG: AraC family transcriptional regulator, partial [Paenibacillus sp.]|nr:AraC family transcriptional regulator [Paenibacillus sp.]